MLDLQSKSDLQSSKISTSLEILVVKLLERPESPLHYSSCSHNYEVRKKKVHLLVSTASTVDLHYYKLLICNTLA